MTRMWRIGVLLAPALAFALGIAHAQTHEPDLQAGQSADMHLPYGMTTAEFKNLKSNADFGVPQAIFNLGSLYEQGNIDGGINLTTAYSLYEKAATKGEKRAQAKLCIAHLLGEGRPADMAKALGYCNKLHDDDAIGLFSAGYDYDHGISGPKDEKTALAFYAQAIKKGSGEAMDAVGQKAMAAGNPAGARKWFRQGVVNGSADAMFHFASLLETGQGGDTDAEEARWLYAAAARGGNIEAEKWLAAHASGALPLAHATLTGRGMITETVETDKGKEARPFEVPDIGKALEKYFPAQAMAEQVSGQATVQCYIDGHNQIDVCLSVYEYPVGYGYGPIILALYNGQLNVAAHDAEGKATAHTIAMYTFNWLTN